MSFLLKIYRPFKNSYWTYVVFVDGKRIDSTPFYYRLYHHKETAIRNGNKFLQKIIAKTLKK